MKRQTQLGRLGAPFLGGLLLLGGASAAGAAAPAGVIHLVDDRGQVIRAPLDVCFQLDLGVSCSSVRSGEVALPPASFQSLRVEGADHGPVRRERARLQTQADGSRRLVVPRKALLRLRAGSPDEPAVSLYDPADPSFRQPVFHGVMRPEGIKIPAGDFVASLTAKGDAPDLQRLSASPAAQIVVTFHRRPGWSLALRCVSAADGKPQANARATLEETPGYGQAARRRGEVASASDGLVLFSGLTSSLASASIRHPGFAPAEARGLVATPGTFAFREVGMVVASRLTARVTVNGKALTGSACRLLSPDREAAGKGASPLALRDQAAVGRDGMCRFQDLSPGIYELRVLIAGGPAQLSRWLSIAPGEAKVEEVALAPAHVRGEVRVGDDPAAGYTVHSLAVDAYRPQGVRAEDAASAQVDTEGRYDLTLWEPSWYSFRVVSDTGAPTAGHRELTIATGDVESLDFRLPDGTIRGVVLDEAGRPVADARVALRWNGIIPLSTDAAGRFEARAAGAGSAELQAFKPRYRPSEPQTVELIQEGQPPPVTLVLRRTSTVTGTVVTADGTPVPGAWIASTSFAPASGIGLYRDSRAGGDGRFEVEVPDGAGSAPSLLFTAGPGCPLSWSLASQGAAASDTADAAVIVPCAAQPAALDLTFVDERGKPLPAAGVVLRANGTVIPQAALAAHLALLGLPSSADGSGHLVLPFLTPGDYDLFLTALSSESTIAAGWPQGFLQRVTLPASTTTELQITFRPGNPDETHIATPPPRP